MFKRARAPQRASVAAWLKSVGDDIFGPTTCARGDAAARLSCRNHGAAADSSTRKRDSGSKLVNVAREGAWHRWFFTLRPRGSTGLGERGLNCDIGAHSFELIGTYNSNFGSVQQDAAALIIDRRPPHKVEVNIPRDSRAAF